MSVKRHEKIFGGGGGNRTRVLLSLPIKDYMLRTRFFTPSELSEFSHHSVTVTVKLYIGTTVSLLFLFG